ncbi:MAG: glycosyltransferase family 4 protein [Luteibaculum sp.]
MNKIGIEAQRIFRAKKHGMDFVAINYIISLANNYPDCKFVVFAKKGPDENALPKMPNIKLVWVPGGPYPIWEQIFLPRYAKKEEVSLLHCTSNTAPLFCKTPLVLTLHDIIFLEKNPLKEGSWYQKFGNLYRRLLVPRIIKTVKHIVTVSHFEEKNIQTRFPKFAEKVSVVYNASNSHFNQFPSPEEIEKTLKNYHLPSSYFVFLGNTDPKKNVDNVLKAYLKLWRNKPDCPSLLVPDYPQTWLDKWYQQNENSEAFKNKIHCAGYIKNQDLQSILARATAFLYPSKRESFGIPILEGFLSKVPVITSNAAAMPEIAGDAAILVDPFNVDSIYQAMDRVLTLNPEQREQLVIAGLERAKQFNWDNSAKELMALYQTI